MGKISQFDLEQMQARTTRARNPAKAKAADAAKAEKFEAGKEGELQDLIQKYAEVNGCYVMRPPMHKRSGYPKGHPDLTILRGEKCCLIECKAGDNKPDDEQWACIERLRRCGNQVLVTWDFQTAADFIRKHLL